MKNIEVNCSFCCFVVLFAVRGEGEGDWMTARCLMGIECRPAWDELEYVLNHKHHL